MVVDLDGLAFGEGVGGVEDDLIVGGEAVGDLDRAAVVLADGDVLQMDLAVAHDADLESLGAEEQRIGWDGEFAALLRNLEVDEDVGAGEQFTVAVVHVDLDVEGAGVGVDGAGVARDRAGEGLARVFVERKGGGVAIVDVGGVDLGDGDEDAQLVDAGDAEEFFGGAAGGGGAGVDEVADVRVALGDDAAVGGVDLLKGLELFEASDVGLSGFDGGALGGGAGDGDIGLLLGDGVQLEEILIALGGGVGEVEVGLGALEVGARDLQLFVELRGLDGGHELALGDVRADVHEPLLEVAAGAGVDGRVVVGLGVAG